jgi:hypothetical protein
MDARATILRSLGSFFCAPLNFNVRVTKEAPRVTGRDPGHLLIKGNYANQSSRSEFSGRTYASRRRTCLPVDEFQLVRAC